MEVQVAALCDAAADYAGKLSILGVFDTIFTAGLPAVQPQCAVALRMVFRKEEEGVHPIVINFVDADGRAVLPALEAAIEVSMPAEVEFVTRNVVLNIQHARFENVGTYAVDVLVAGRHIASIPLQVRAVG